jgi:DivIVA domain-containing protein
VTREDPFARRPAQSPYTIRHKSFPARRKGLDPNEVQEYLNELAEQIEYADADRAELRAEVERLRATSPDSQQRAHITAHAVGLLSQAQQIADNLVAEAEQYAKDLVETARDQQRDALKQAHETVETAVKHMPPTPDAPVADLEYVRTFTRVAHVQLRSVLDALAEQVERLGQFPEASGEAGEARHPDRPSGSSDAGSGEVLWWTDLSAAADNSILDTATHLRPN